MEMLLSGVALQVLALALLILMLANGDAARSLIVRIRSDGHTEPSPNEAADARRRQMLRGVIGLFLGGTLLALLGLPRL